MLTSQLAQEKQKLTEQLSALHEQKNKITIDYQNSQDSNQNKIREVNQKILELQEEIKAIDLKLYSGGKV